METLILWQVIAFIGKVLIKVGIVAFEFQQAANEHVIHNNNNAEIEKTFISKVDR